MKKLLLLLVGIILTSCAPDAPAQETPRPITCPTEQSNTFTVIWESNQTNPYIEVTLYEFKDCKIISEVTTRYNVKQFDVQIKSNQMFAMQIKKESTVKNPELYLSIYKGNILQYEQTVRTGGFGLNSFVDRDGNIGKNEE